MSKLSFYYTDGSGNHFRFWQEAEQIHFEYDPVQPQFSSSGVYSGGTAKKGILTAEQAAILRQRFTFWQEATAEHVERRMKGVSILSIEKDKGRTSFLVPESKLKELSAMLRPLRP